MNRLARVAGNLGKRLYSVNDNILGRNFETNLIDSSKFLVSSRARLSNVVGDTNEDVQSIEKKKVINRLLYRSRQRGYLELDLIIGKWAQRNVQSLTNDQVQALTELLDEENPDLWKWITGQVEPPEKLQKNPIFASISSEIESQLKLHSDPNTRAIPGAPWVRGWDDKDKKEPFSPPAGNQ